MRGSQPRAPPEFVGFDQLLYVRFARPDFWQALRNIMIFVLLVVPLQGTLGLVLAILINEKLRGRTAFRVMFFLPVVTSMVVVSILWQIMYQDGLFNAITAAQRRLAQQPGDRPSGDRGDVGLAGRRLPHDRVVDRTPDHPRELYEAASIDGASNGASSGM